MVKLNLLLGIHNNKYNTAFTLASYHALTWFGTTRLCFHYSTSTHQTESNQALICCASTIRFGMCPLENKEIQYQQEEHTITYLWISTTS